MSAASGLSSWWTSPPIDAALEVSSERIAGLVLAGRARVRAHAVEQLPAGALVPSLTAQNLAAADIVRQATARVLDAIGRPRRVALVVPDSVARLSIVRLDHVPADPAEREQLIRFNVRKSVPFPLDGALLSTAEGQTLTGGGREFVVSVARRDVIEEYEQLCAAAHADAGIVDVAACGTLNMVLASAPVEADWMLVHIAADATTIAIVRGTAPIFFRVTPPDTTAALSDAVFQSAMYHVDRLDGRGLARVTIADRTGRPDLGDAVVRTFEGRADVAVERLGAAGFPSFGDRIDIGADLVAALAGGVGTLAAHA